MEFIERIFTDFSEIHGDRAFGDDEAVACGMARLGDDEVMVIGNRKGGSTCPTRRAIARRCDR
jgi:acetyl-CoA carboxylase carboxyl transferase subunit alpha